MIEQFRNAALAERLVSMATVTLRAKDLTPPVWENAEALIQCAVRLAPDEPRFQRFLYEASIHTGDGDTALRALNAYRNLRPDDEFAQVELIDIYLGRMERSDKKLDYLDQIIGAAQVPATVRSVAAVRSAQVYAERMQDGKARDMIARAIDLNPLNLEALRIKITTMPPKATQDRLALLLQMLRSNPAQPALGLQVAQELARVGLAQQSLEWYNQSLDLHRRVGIAPPATIGADYAAELYISGDSRSAAVVADTLTKQNPDDLNAWLIKLVLARSVGDKDLMAKTLKQANVAFANRLAMIRKAAGDVAATTRPVDDPAEVTLPDPAAELQKLSGKPELVAQFAPVGAAIAWEKVYFDDKPGVAAQWIKALTAIAGENDPMLTRLQGWAFLVAGNNDAARSKLQAVADSDPLAALGLIRLEGDSAKTDEQAKKLLSENTWGLTGAVLTQAFASRGIKPALAPEGQQVLKVLDAFPKNWMRILDTPQQYYSLRLDPVRVGVNVGEPVLVQVTVTNVGDQPLTVGPDGVIHRDLWLDAQLRGAQTATFSAEAYQQLAGPLVLQPKDSASQVVRLDQRGLAGLLEQYPTSTFQIAAMVMTNPTTMNGQVNVGLAGNRAMLSSLMQRNGSPVGQPAVQQRLADALQNGAPDEKVRACETLVKFAQMLSGEGSSDAAKQMAAQSAEAVRHTINDDDPTVHAWATYLFTALTADKNRAAAMLKDPSWLMRALGTVVLDFAGADRSLLKPLAENDPDPVIRRLAASAMVAPKRVAASQPATSQPAAGGAAASPASGTAPPAAAVP